MKTDVKKELKSIVSKYNVHENEIIDITKKYEELLKK